MGCGSGFFSFFLTQLGHHVTGIDLTSSMIKEAKRSSEKLKIYPEFHIMDAEQIQYSAETFDVLVTRNLTWTLPHPEIAYMEWYRVLKPGGLLLNIDANYGLEQFSGTDKLPHNHVHQEIDTSLLGECDHIKAQLPISYRNRPSWDLQALEVSGFSSVSIDFSISNRIYLTEDEFYNPVPLFLIKATK